MYFILIEFGIIKNIIIKLTSLNFIFRSDTFFL